MLDPSPHRISNYNTAQATKPAWHGVKADMWTNELEQKI